MTVRIAAVAAPRAAVALALPLNARAGYAFFPLARRIGITANGATMVLDHHWLLMPPLQCYP